jgi:hypothetical protein
MKIVSANYQNYFKTQDQVNQAGIVMTRMFEQWDYNLIEKAVYKYMESGTAFPPNPGQLIALAKEIRRTEWEEQKRRTDLLPEPELKREPCPPEIMAKMKNLFKMPEGME